MTKTRYLKITSHAEEHIERLEEFKDSIFNTVYEDLYNVINRIVREKDRKRGDIITLTGNRGSGKSTVMDSFVKSLNEYDNPYLSGVKRDDGIGFSVLESLDASLLESEEDVFDIILARMLKNIESTFIRTNNNQGRISEEKAEILEQFDHIFGSHQIIKEQKKQEALKGYSPLSALKHFADSQGLAEQFHLLVKKYLHLMLQDSLEYKKTCGQTYLVIPIDDLDMNVEHGFHSLEQIYRYLAVKNVIVVLTIKYEQMEYLLEKDAHKLFPKINREFEPDKLVYIENFSREYLEKMLPVQRRVYMPDMNRWAISQNESWLIKDGEEEKNIKTSILFKICKNTGMYFDICGTKKHFLEPESLRELNGYYEFLRLKMLSPNEEEKKQIMLGNCNHFIYDVCNRLIFGKLLKDYREEMLLLCKLNYAGFNNRLFGFLQEKSVSNKEMLYKPRVSYGEILRLLYLFSRKREEEKQFVYGILVLYTYLAQKLLMDDTQNKIEIGQLFVNSWAGAWSNTIVPRLHIRPEANVISEYDTYWGFMDKIALDSVNMKFESSALKENVSIQNKLYWRYKGFFPALEWFFFFFESFSSKGTGKNNMQLKIQENEKQEIEWTFQNTQCDFNILAFIKHSFNYEEYFKTLYTAIAEAILQANDSTIVQPELKEIEKLRDEMLKVSPMYKEYQAWNESSKGIVVPFQHADIYYHILHRLQIWRQENRCNRIEEQDLLNVLREVFEQIQKQLKEQNNAYDGIPNWEQNFVQCPFVEKVLNKKTPIADEAFGRLITLFAQKSIVNKQLKVLKDELTTSDDLDEKYLDW